MMVGIFGNLSAGKTVLAVSLISKEKKKIYSNIFLKLPYYHISIDEIFQYAISDSMIFKDSILFIDEIHNIVDARRSSSDLNQKFTQFLTQVGKLSCDLIFTSQILSSQIDIRLRELCDIYIFCMRYKVMNNSLVPIIFGDRIITDKIIIKADMFIKLQAGMKVVHKSFSIDPEPYYNLYDTREIVLLDRSKYLK